MSTKSKFPNRLPVNDENHKGMKRVALDEDSTVVEIGNQFIANALKSRKTNRRTGKRQGV